MNEKQTDDHGEENWDQFSTLDAKQKRQELDVECGRAYFLSHGIQTFCNQTTAPDTPQSPSRNRATNANMSPERIDIYRIPPNCYELHWAEGTETFTGFTSAMACGQARPNARQLMRV